MTSLAGCSTQVGEVQEGGRRKGGTPARPQAERVPARWWLGLPLLLEETPSP